MSRAAARRKALFDLAAFEPVAKKTDNRTERALTAMHELAHEPQRSADLRMDDIARVMRYARVLMDQIAREDASANERTAGV